MANARIEERRLVWNPSQGKYVEPEEMILVNRQRKPLAGQGVRAGLFLKGPIPWWWIVAAAKLPANALIVGLSLWRLAGATKKTTVILSNVEIEPFGISRSAKSRAITALEDAGLIKVVHQKGRFPSITLDDRWDGATTKRADSAIAS